MGDETTTNETLRDGRDVRAWLNERVTIDRLARKMAAAVSMPDADEADFMTPDMLRREEERRRGFDIVSLQPHERVNG